MSFRTLAASLGVVAALCFVSPAPAQEDSGASKARPKGKAAAPSRKAGAAKGKATADAKVKTEKATFGGGCFWCQEAVFERVRGVKSVVSGYAGGNVPNPNYEMVHTGLTGHAEVIQIEYDPSVVSYEDLLKIFWQSHDPTTLNRQGPDAGTQYRSIILYHNEEQKKAAQKSYEELTAARAFPSPIVTQLVPLKRFYPAERYHQNFYRLHPYDPYSLSEIAPKVEMMRAKLQSAAPPR